MFYIDCVAKFPGGYQRIWTEVVSGDVVDDACENFLDGLKTMGVDQDHYIIIQMLPANDATYIEALAKANRK